VRRMETLLVRLKAFDPRQRHTLRRYTYRGIVFAEDRGWCRVEADVAAYLRGVRQVPDDPHAPAAFDVCTDEEARRLDAADEAGSRRRVTSDDPVPFVRARDAGALSTDDLPKGLPPKAAEPKAAEPKSEAKAEGAESKRGKG
jgi:hypothetical protein